MDSEDSMVPEVDSSDPDQVKEVKGLLMADLEKIFSYAIKTVVNLGYDQKKVEAAISTKSICSNGGDYITNIVEDTVKNLMCDETTLVFPNLQKLAEHTMDELVLIRRNKYPSETLIVALSELWYLFNFYLGSFKLKNNSGKPLMQDEKNAQGSKLLTRAQEVDSSDPETVKAVKGLLMADLEKFFSYAIKTVVGLGYDQKKVEAALSRKSINLYTKGGDHITNIVQDTVKNLTREGSETTHDIVFQNLQKFVEYTLNELVVIHRKKNPSMTFAVALIQLWQALNSYLDSLRENNYDKPPMADEKNAQFSKLLTPAQESDPDIVKAVKGSLMADFEEAFTYDSIKREYDSFKREFNSDKPPMADEKNAQLSKLLTRAQEVDSSDPDKVKVVKGLLMAVLEKIFSYAIKTVVDLGYDQKMVEAAISRKSIYSKEGDHITNIVQDTLKNLTGEGSETTLDTVFPNLQKLVECTLDELVLIHHKKNPSVTLAVALSELSCVLNSYLESFKRENNPDTPPMPDEKNAQLSKLLLRAKELQVEVEGWNRWENEKVMEVAVKLHTYQAETKVFKKITEAYRNLKTSEENAHKGVSDGVLIHTENNEKKHRSAASRILILEVRKSLLEKALEAAESLLLSERFMEIRQEALEHVQEVQSLVQKKSTISYKLEEEREKLSLVKEKIETEDDRLARNKVKLQDERAKTQRSLQKASWNSKREEYEELEKGRRALEEKVMEKISEGENAIKSHESQLDELTSSILTLEKEMSSVDNGLESAKSTADRQQVQDREQTAIQQTESLASEISLLLRELELENDKLVNLQQEIDNGKNLLANNEDIVKKERARTEEILADATVMIELREQHEALMKAEEDAIREKAADERKEYAKSIAKIEKEVSMLLGHD